MGIVALFRLLLFGALVYMGVRAVKGLIRAATIGSIEDDVEQDPTAGAATNRRSSRDAACEVLGVEPGAPAAEIKAAYQALVRQYHPDRVADLGAELRDLAERKTKQINAAYTLLKRG